MNADAAPAEMLLGIDVGTSRIKGLLIDRAGRESVLPAVPTPFESKGEGVEMGSHDLRRALRDLLAGLGTRAGRVRGVGVAGIAESGAPLGEGGRPLAPVIAWHDPRGQETVQHLLEEFGPGLSERIGQRLRTVSSVAKVGWLAANGVEGIRRWLGVPELCAWLLTGTECTEHSLASRSGWYDVAAREYLPEVARAAGVPGDALPPVRAAGSAMGGVRREAAAWSGLPPGIPVTIAGHDHLVGAPGSGAAPADLVNSVGTAETVLRAREDLPPIRRAVELRCAVSVSPGGRGYTVLAGAARAGVVIAGAASSLSLAPGDLDRLAEGARPIDAARFVEAIRAGRAEPPPSGPRGSVWAGVLEVLVHQVLEARARLSEVAGEGERIVVFGGGARSRPWMSAKARLAGVPVLRSSSAEAAARGAALFAGAAAGWWPGLEAGPSAGLEPVVPDG